MDIKWKDGEGNILNANSEKIIYLNAKDNKKITIQKDKIKKITIEDRLMNVFKDFQNELIISIVIPKKNKRDAVKIFNEFDKTGEMLKGKSSHFLLNLILDSSFILGNPFIGIGATIFIGTILFLFITDIMGPIVQEVFLTLVRAILFGYPAYLLLSYIRTKIKRKRIKEI